MTEDEIRRTLIELAQLLFPGRDRGELAVLALRGEVLTIRPEPAPPAPPGQVPEGVSEYDAAILRALRDPPQSSPRLARAAGHRHNSYFRGRLAALVEAGHVRHTRRGYSRHER
jgi:hypothetical protein